LNKRKLVIIDQRQFGYHTGNYHYCKYLKNDFKVVYICWNQNYQKINMPDVRVIYVNRKRNMIFRSLLFLRHAINELDNDPAVVFIKYFKTVSLTLRLLRPTHIFVLDIRTGSVHKNQIIRKLHDTRLKLEARFFKNVTVISESLAEKLSISHKAHILPLGADVISSKNKTFKELNLLYVGTLHNRNIEITIHGFKKFYDEFKNQITITYTIIGSGPNNEEVGLRDIVAKFGISEAVKMTGQIPHNQLASFFDNSNIGISYVPLTDYYDVQPVTKTFEYLLSGMPVIATNTSENRKVINQENGILVGETPENFYSGLKEIYRKREMFDSEKIRESSRDYTWENIVRNNMKKYFDRIQTG